MMEIKSYPKPIKNALKDTTKTIRREKKSGLKERKKESKEERKKGRKKERESPGCVCLASGQIWIKWMMIRTLCENTSLIFNQTKCCLCPATLVRTSGLEDEWMKCCLCWFPQRNPLMFFMFRTGSPARLHLLPLALHIRVDQTLFTQHISYQTICLFWDYRRLSPDDGGSPAGPERSVDSHLL